MKSVCTVYQDMNYDAAAAECVARGMNLLNVDSADVENYMLSYSNIQWSFGFFWYLGKAGAVCSSFINEKRLFYYKLQIPCLSIGYFHCEYQSKFKEVKL